MKSPGLRLGALCILLCSEAVFGLGQAPYVATNAAAGSFPLVQNGAAAAVYVDADDQWGVARAAGDFRRDVQRVTGALPSAEKSGARDVVVVGSLGHSALIDQLAREGKIDAGAIAGKWESWLRVVVTNPAPDIDRALVIAGSDKRGAIYGIYDLSEQIGVSPWYWWADVPPRKSAGLWVDAARFVSQPPAVRYRGIFLNDEAPDLTGWVKEKFGNYNHAFYTNVFELLLRLKANYLWPAMWDNCFSEDDAENPRLADAYGIVMGTSHVEPMMRADKEWNRLGFTAAQWNYDKNPDELRKFWREGVERNKPYENIITIAMRGKIDTPMSESANIALLEKIVAAQREIIADVYQTNGESVPQLWALYKEVQEYYEKGMRVPDDVTLLWCDDNWGDIRRLPTPEERHRAGGAGVYYHFDYVGGPRNYKWLNTCPITKTWEQMNLAYDYGADRIWIVNVGHLHHVMFPMEFFLTLAWNPKAWPASRLGDYGRLWATREFGAEHAEEIADIVAKYTKWNARRKPELLEPETFSLTNYDEAGRVVADWTALDLEASQLTRKIPGDARGAFQELVLMPVKLCANLNEMYLAAAKNHFYAKRGEAEAANAYANLTGRLFTNDAALSDYFNHILEQGKWDHMMDQTHIGYTYWQQPPVNKMPDVTWLAGATFPRVADGDGGMAQVRGAPPSLPADFRGFAEADGYVSIEAGHYTSETQTEAGRWTAIPDYGRTLGAMTIMPTTGASVLPPGQAPELDYQIYFSTTNRVEVRAIMAPTLNFVPGRGLRLAVSFDDGAPQVVDALADNSLHAWEESVKDNARSVRSGHEIATAGYHTLKIRMVDPGVVLEKIVIDCGGLRPSYLGPPESYHR